MNKILNVIVAVTRKTLGIGKDGALPWRLPGDMDRFREITSKTVDDTKKNAVIMGRKTYESIPRKFRPLPGRLNIVLTRDPSLRECLNIPNDVILVDSLDAAVKCVTTGEVAKNIDQIFVIGGSSVYKDALKSPLCKRIYMTVINKEFECDTFFPKVSDFGYSSTNDCIEKREENGISYEFQVLEKKHEELQYHDLIKDILSNGIHRSDRTQTGTISKFGVHMRFNLRENVFPLLTTKRVFWRGVAEELLWFISGDTNAQTLQAKNIHIWDGNGSRSYLDSLGLTHREEGDLGPVYGFQWRHFGAEYIDMHTDYQGKGVDQLAQVIETIKTNPNDRRIILSAWNPTDLKKMALPPCHMFCQFYVADGELSCQFYQRSADMGLGVPFNIASYALLTRLIAQVCDLQPGELIHVIGDAHVYSNHVDPLKEQITRTPRAFPTLTINPEKKDIDDFVFDDFTLDDYCPHKSIKMDMSV